MVIIKILQRKDAASIIIAIAIGMVLAGLVGGFTSEISRGLSGLETADVDWKATYVFPVISAVIQFVTLEVFTRIFIALREAYIKR